jgi:ATPase subunit of ABC transporter with duplicated ATPase domains
MRKTARRKQKRKTARHKQKRKTARHKQKRKTARRKQKRKTARRSCGFAIRRQKRLDHFKADLQSASSEFAYLASVLLADCKSAIVTHSMADYKSAKTEW